MSRQDAIDRVQKYYDGSSGGAEQLSSMLDDYMRIRFGMQPLDKPRESTAPLYPGLVGYAIALNLFGERILIYANGHISAPEGWEGIDVENRIPVLLAQAGDEAVRQAFAASEGKLWSDPRAVEARDYLQKIMGGLPASTPHFRKLDALLRKLDALAGTPVMPEPPGMPRPVAELGNPPFGQDQYPDPEWSAAELELMRERFSDKLIPRTEELAGAMAPGPNYREPAAWLEAFKTAFRIEGNWLSTAALELIENLDLGRWEIVSHVPPQRDFAAQFTNEIVTAMRELSVQNPAYEMLKGAMAKMGPNGQIQQD